MSQSLTLEGLVDKLAEGVIVPLGVDEWVGVAEHFPLVDDIDTFMNPAGPAPCSGGQEAGLGHRRGSRAQPEGDPAPEERKRSPGADRRPSGRLRADVGRLRRLQTGLFQLTGSRFWYM